MKKLTIIAILSVFSFAGFAQENSGGGKKLSFSVGLEANMPIGDMADGYNIGIGGSAMAAYKLSSKAAATLSAGYVTYGGKEITILGITAKNDALNVIPVMAGLKYNLAEKIYAHGQLGMSFWTAGDANDSDFTWNLGVGYMITDNIDVALRFNSINAGTALNAVGLRVAYNF